MIKAMFILVSVILLTGCIKKEDTEPKILVPKNSWKYYDISYLKRDAKWTKRRKNDSYEDSLEVLNFVATDTTGFLSLSFTEKPVAGRRYQVVYEPATTGQVCINATGGAGRGHAGSQDDAGKFLDVSDDNGKLHFYIEKVELEVYTMVSNYNVDCSINLTE